MKYISDIIQFKVHPKVGAFVIKKSVFIVGLGLLLYFGILINYLLLQKELSTQLNILFIFIVVFLVSSLIIFYYVKYSQLQYVFYETYFSAGDRKISYDSIIKIEVKDSSLDNYLKVGCITLFLENNKKFKISNISELNNVYFFLQKKIKK